MGVALLYIIAFMGAGDIYKSIDATYQKLNEE